MLEVYPSESYFINAYLKLSVDESDKTEFEEVPATYKSDPGISSN